MKEKHKKSGTTRINFIRVIDEWTSKMNERVAMHVLPLTSMCYMHAIYDICCCCCWCDCFVSIVNALQRMHFNWFHVLQLIKCLLLMFCCSCCCCLYAVCLICWHSLYLNIDGITHWLHLCDTIFLDLIRWFSRADNWLLFFNHEMIK